MSAKLRDNWLVIQLISTSTPYFQLQALLRGLSVDQVLAISEIAANTFYGNITISRESTLKLKPYKKVFQYLSNPLHTASNKRKYLIRNKVALQILIEAVNKSVNKILKDECEEDSEECDSDLGSLSPTVE
jgi:TATA-binding protein-associated factor Taf7